MRCYIWGHNNSTDRKLAGRGVASFVIPDWGLQFRAAHEGDALACEVAALLALIRFAESNTKVFEGSRTEVLTDSSLLVDVLLGKLEPEEAHVRQFILIRALRERTPFEISWIPPAENRAIEGVLDLPPLKHKFQIDHSNSQRRNLPDAPHRRYNS